MFPDTTIGFSSNESVSFREGENIQVDPVMNQSYIRNKERTRFVLEGHLGLLNVIQNDGNLVSTGGIYSIFIWSIGRGCTYVIDKLAEKMSMVGSKSKLILPKTPLSSFTLEFHKLNKALKAGLTALTWL